MFYEVEVVIDGKSHEVKVDAAGSIEDESKGDDDDQKNAKGEREDDDDKD